MRVRPALFEAGPDWLDDAAAFVRERVIPLEPLLLSHDYEALRGELAAVRADVKARGWWAPQAAKELGGVGLSLVDFAPVAEVLGVSPLGALAFQAQAPDAGNIELLHEHASDAQRARWLAPLVAGEIRSCFAMTEPEHAGSNPVVLSTRAVLEGDEWVIDGHKWFTTAAEGAAFTIVMAVTEPDASKYARASMIIVPLDTPGVERVRNISVMGEAGAGYASHAELRFVGARVPANSLLGGRGQGFLLAQQRLGPGRIHHCMRWIGIAERAHDAMVARAASRDLGGGKPLGTRQIVQSWIATSRAEIDAARLLVLDAAARIERDGAYAARDAISAIKFHVAGVMHRVLDHAIQTHGALGVTDDTILAYLWRHERAARIYDGPDEVHQMVVARHALERAGMARRPGNG